MGSMRKARGLAGAGEERGRGRGKGGEGEKKGREERGRGKGERKGHFLPSKFNRSAL